MKNRLLIGLVIFIALIIGITLGASVVIKMYRKIPVATTTSSTVLSAIPPVAKTGTQTSSVTWLSPEELGSATSASAYTPSSGLAAALKSITDLSTTAVGYEKYEGDNSALLLSMGETHLLWFVFENERFGYSPVLRKSFSTQACDKVFLKKEGGEIILSIDPSCSNSGSDKGFEYYRYGHNAIETFAYKETGYSLDRRYSFSLDEEKTMIPIEPVFSTDCTSLTGASASTNLIGLRIAGATQSLTSSKVACDEIDYMGGPQFGDPETSFVEYDPFYSTLTLKLPNGKLIFIDVNTKKVVAMKARYSEPCLSFAGNQSLTYTTPSSTTVLIENITNDPILNPDKKMSTNGNACLRLLNPNAIGNPQYQMTFNYGEGYGLGSTYEFDLKTRTFKKLK